MKKIVDIGFSPCPNDTFIFDALVNRKIDTGNLVFNPVLEDVETLNRWALEEKLPVTKLSYGTLSHVLTNYLLLRSGSALGRGVGPLLVTSPELKDAQVEETQIAIPGEHTTAHVLFSLAYPEAKRKKFLRYNEIQDFVASGKGLGVIIHENRFTYESYGLIKLCDLGSKWEEKMKVPIPLGGIVAAKHLGAETKQIRDLIRRSIEYAYNQLPVLSEFITSNAMEMDENVMRQHIGLYVNHFSIDLGPDGIHAVTEFLKIYQSLNPGSYASLQIA